MAASRGRVETYVAFLRGINVGGRALVSMADLQEAFRSAGCQAVRTYINSGNVVFEARPEETVTLFKRISNTLAPLFERCPAIAFRTVEALRDLVAEDPFKRARRETGAAFYVTFLAGEPATLPKFPLAVPKEALEAIGMNGLDVFMISRPKPNGMYGFPNEPIEKAFGVAATTRNWKTVAKIVDFALRTEVSRRPGATPPAPRRTTRQGAPRTRSPKA